MGNLTAGRGFVKCGGSSLEIIALPFGDPAREDCVCSSAIEKTRGCDVPFMVYSESEQTVRGSSGLGSVSRIRASANISARLFVWIGPGSRSARFLFPCQVVQEQGGEGRSYGAFGLFDQQTPIPALDPCLPFPSADPSQYTLRELESAVAPPLFESLSSRLIRFPSRSSFSTVRFLLPLADGAGAKTSKEAEMKERASALVGNFWNLALGKPLTCASACAQVG